MWNVIFFGSFGWCNTSSWVVVDPYLTTNQSRTWITCHLNRSPPTQLISRCKDAFHQRFGVVCADLCIKGSSNGSPGQCFVVRAIEEDGLASESWKSPICSQFFTIVAYRFKKVHLWCCRLCQSKDYCKKFLDCCVGNTEAVPFFLDM